MERVVFKRTPDRLSTSYFLSSVRCTLPFEESDIRCGVRPPSTGASYLPYIN